MDRTANNAHKSDASSCWKPLAFDERSPIVKEKCKKVKAQTLNAPVKLRLLYST